jgi:CRP-like cAMP-binding protein
VIGLVEPGESFGEPVMFLGKPYLVTATALADSLVLHVGREAVLAEIARNPGFATRVIGALAARTESLVRELQAQALGSASQRFVAWLLRDPALRAESGAATLRLPASKRLLAARLNCSAEHLSRILHDLSEAGLLAVHGRDLTVPAVERLRERSPPLR